MARLIEAYLSDDFPENTRLIPYDMRPTGAEVPYRCCIYKERAILKTRLIANLGFPLEDDDERVNLTTYAKEAEARTQISDKHLTVLQQACKGCSSNSIFVTDICQGCVARPCTNACKFGAITVGDGRAKIDPEKCKKCQMCINACPYHAIVKLSVPCEDVCPVGAIKKDEKKPAPADKKDTKKDAKKEPKTKPKTAEKKDEKKDPTSPDNDVTMKDCTKDNKENPPKVENKAENEKMDVD